MTDREKTQFNFSDLECEKLFNDAESFVPSNRDIGPIYDEIRSSSERYANFKHIASGGMKSIYKVFDHKTGRFVAMAKLLPEAPEELYEVFLREARLTALLDHPNIISIFDLGVNDENAPFFTMELQTGQTLKEVIGQCHKPGEKNIDLTNLLEIFIKICDGVAYAHSQNVLHLDLKPANVQVGNFGEVIICDWGLGKVLGKPSYSDHEFEQLLLNPDLLNHMTLSNEIKGTPGYMAPEQTEKGSEKTFQTDIYSLGAILYTILCGKNSVAENEPLEKCLENIRSGLIKSPVDSAPNLQIPPALNAVVMKAMQTDPHARYQTVEELRNEVHNYLTGYSTTAENAGVFKELTLFYKRNRTLSLVTAIFIFCIILTTSLFISRLKESLNAEMSARKIAETNRLMALEEKSRAQEALKLYKEEKEWADSYIAKNIDQMADGVYSFSDDMVFTDPKNALKTARQSLDRILAIKPNFQWAYWQRGYVSFLMLDLNQALKDFKIVPNSAKRLEKICTKYQNCTFENGVLGIDDMSALIRDLSTEKINHVCAYILTLADRQKRKSLSEHSRLVKEVLQIFNPDWKSEKVFLFDEKSATLKLSGKGLKNLAIEARYFPALVFPDKNVKFSLLQTLGLKSLDISGSEIGDLSQLKSQKITKLDVSNTAISNFVQLRKFLPNLQKLTVDQKQYNKLSTLPVIKNLEIVVRR